MSRNDLDGSKWLLPLLSLAVPLSAFLLSGAKRKRRKHSSVIQENVFTGPQQPVAISHGSTHLDDDEGEITIFSREGWIPAGGGKAVKVAGNGKLYQDACVKGAYATCYHPDGVSCYFPVDPNTKELCLTLVFVSNNETIKLKAESANSGNQLSVSFSGNQPYTFKSLDSTQPGLLTFVDGNGKALLGKLVQTGCSASGHSPNKSGLNIGINYE